MFYSKHLFYKDRMTSCTHFFQEKSKMLFKVAFAYTSVTAARKKKCVICSGNSVYLDMWQYTAAQSTANLALSRKKS